MRIEGEATEAELWSRPGDQRDTTSSEHQSAVPTTDPAPADTPVSPPTKRLNVALVGLILAVTLVAGFTVLLRGGGPGAPTTTIAVGLRSAQPPVLHPSTERVRAKAVIGAGDALGDGGNGVDAQLIDPTGVAVDSAGNVYVSDAGSRRVRRIDSDGRITTVLGGPAITRQRLLLDEPGQLTVDANGSLYIPDATRQRVIRLDRSGATELAGVNPPEGDAPLGASSAAAMGVDGQLAVTSPDRARVTVVNPATGAITELASNPVHFVHPTGILAVGSGGWLVVDQGLGALVMVNPAGVSTVIASTLRGSTRTGSTLTGSTLTGSTPITLAAPPIAVSALPDGLLAVALEGTTGIVVMRPGDPSSLQTWADGDGADGVRPTALYLGPDGRLLVADGRGRRIVRIDPARPTVIRLVAGRGVWQPAPHQSALDLALRSPTAIAAAPDAGLWVADPHAGRVWLVEANGSARVAAGTGADDDSVDGALATATAFARPTFLASTNDGTLYVGEVGAHRVRRIDPLGVVTTMATGIDPGPMVVLANATLVIAPVGGTTLMYVSPNGAVRFTPSPVPHPSALALGEDGSLFLVDDISNRILRVRGTSVTVVATGVGDPLGGANASAAMALGTNPDQLTTIAGVAALPGGEGGEGSGVTLLVADFWADRLARVSADTTVTTFIGTSPAPVTASPLSQRLRRPTQLVADAQGGVAILQQERRNIRYMRADGTVETIAGSSDDGGSGGTDPSTVAISPGSGLAALGKQLVVADGGHQRVRLIGADRVDTIIGSGAQGNRSGSQDPPVLQLDSPRGVTVSGHLVMVADTANHRVMMLDGTGLATIIAGTGLPGNGEPIGLASGVALLRPSAVLVLNKRTYIADTGNDRVLRVEPNGSLRLVARVAQPSGLAARSDGTLLVTSTADNQVRAFSPDGALHILAGFGTAGFSGDGGPADVARLNGPTGIAVTPDGSVWVCDTGNNMVRRIAPDGIITTVADRTSGIDAPVGIVVDPSFGMVLSDSSSHLLQVTPAELDRVASGWSKAP